MQTALLLVDIQNDYFPGGKNPLVRSVEAASKAKLLLELFRAKDMPLIHIRHVSAKPDATFFLPYTQGIQIYEKVKPLEGETVITKNFPNSFRNTGLLQALKIAEVNRLVICGMMTHMCIDSTTRAANEHGFECIVASDACATKDLKFESDMVPAEQVHKAFLSALNGTFATVAPTEQVVKLIK